jgi:hypothetical protein
LEFSNLFTNFVQLLLIFGSGRHSSRSSIPFFLPFLLFVYKPSLNIIHTLFQSTNVAYSPLFELFKTLGNHQERARHIQRSLSIKLGIERRDIA